MLKHQSHCQCEHCWLECLVVWGKDPPTLKPSVHCKKKQKGQKTGTNCAAGSLNVSGAMVLLCCKIDTDLICMLDQWHSDIMM